jgi:phosphoribosylglycinamide formyltransferase 1
MKARWALFISGQGSNMSALLDQKWDLDIALVVSSSPKAQGLKRAQRSGVPTVTLDAKIDWHQLTADLQRLRITHIFLLGFMKIVPPEFLKSWTGVILNVHPSLLPHYPGLKSIERAYHDGADMGITVHHVNEQVDAGHVVLQKTVVPGNLVKNLSLESAEAKMHQAEYALVRRAVERVYA